MEIFSKYKKIIITATVLVLLFVAYGFFFKGENTGSLVVTEDAISAKQFAAGKELISLLVDLKSLKLNPDIFENNVFRSLEDFGLSLPPEPQGRENPFLPTEQI